MRLGKMMLFSALGLSLLAGCVNSPTSPKGPKPPLSVPLVYRPKSNDSGLVSMIRGKVALTVVDERAKKDAIGQNIEKATPIGVVSTDDPAVFVRDTAMRQLQQRGGTVVEAKDADKRLVLHLQEFWTTETSTYNTEVRLRGELVDRYGKVLWEALATGKGSNFGRSLNAQNYQESISQATDRAVALLVNEPSLAAALSK